MNSVLGKIRLLYEGKVEEVSVVMKCVFYTILVVLVACLISIILFKLKLKVISVENFVIVGLCGYILVYSFNTINIITKEKKHIKELENSNKILLEENDKIRIIKHDFNNILQVMDGYVEIEDVSSLKRYMKKLIGEINETESIKVINKSFLNNCALASLLKKKYSKAKKENINITLEIMYELKLLQKYEYELTRILGIFLDNAIEAEKEECNKMISVLFYKDRNYKYIIIENTFENKMIDINKIYEKEFSTKKGNTGLGLWEVRNIIDRIDAMSLKTIIENNCFKHILKVS